MFSLFRHYLNADEKVFMINGTSLFEWNVAEIIKAGHSTLYKLKRDESDSFCMVEHGRLGEDIFRTKEDALKELSRRRSDDKKQKSLKKIQ